MTATCHNCDKLAIDRYYNNHLESQTQKKNFVKDKIKGIQLIQLHHKNKS